MHPSSMENMRRVRNKYLPEVSEEWKVLDVGGRGLASDRSYRGVFPEPKEYLVADIQEGLGVTHMMPGPYTLPFDNDTFDLIVSGQMLEHCSNPFKSVAEMQRVLKPGGHIAIIVPSSGPYHDSQDGWRFLKDAFRFIGEDIGGFETVADWIDTNAPDQRSRKWQDHVWVARKI